MTQVVYLERLDDLGAKNIASVGNLPGPGGGDGWVTVSEIPTARLQSSHHYAFWVTGKIANVQRSGTFPNAGILQVCLGDAAGTRHPDYLVEIGFGANLGAREAIPFEFLLIFGGQPVPLTDPLWGSSWANTFALQLHARIYRRGDAPTYTGSFDVVDLCWVWADLDAIPVGDQLVTRQATPLALSNATAPVPLAQSTNAVPGSAGDMWVHFWSLAYRPGVGAIPAFKVGYVTDAFFGGFAAKNGSGGALGLNHRGTNIYGVLQHHGGFWAEPKAATPVLPAVAAHDKVTGAQATGLHSFTVLSIRLEDLGNVHLGSSPTELALTEWEIRRGTTSRFFPLEVAAEGRTWEPWTFATGIPSGPPPTDIYLEDNNGFPLFFAQGFLRMSAPEEQACCNGSSVHGLGSGNPGVQYRLWFLEIAAVTPPPRTVNDVYLLTFYPTKNPDNQPPDPNTVGDPVEIVPGTESLGVGSLLDPPLVPNINAPENPTIQREELRGTTGYTRTWTGFLATRREFPLTWGPVSETQRDDLLEFLRAHRVFRFTPPREAAPIPIMQTSKPTSRALGDFKAYEVVVDVAELVYTGP